MKGETLWVKEKKSCTKVGKVCKARQSKK